MFEENQDFNEVIPLDEISTNTLETLLHFCEMHENSNENFVQRPILSTNLSDVFPEWEA
eukprot:CAMPEP_0202961202 /NCGR_PEP_ID=MMETSP1396-20130829/5261_1 /ASSEMBLY_ACC=CAM_ASM_000872 /TAXON_ID= /ORGANISM="Pseudokeronopsis sp., Strain Brazil" /LENGTH=58 /DNA_ID=CAMNT_0049680855 /DNA_START=86 /DNA_END=258 /DNA_ORIENTATION=-